MTQAESRSAGPSAPGGSRKPCAPAWCQHLGLLAILLVNVVLRAPNLGHPYLKTMDESFHAVVARNLLYNPLEPTLVREPYLRYNPTDWLDNHVWLHKPALPLWIIAISYKLLGVNALALRLPSLILSTLAVWLTFLIARRLFGPVPGLIAAALQATAPAIGMIVQGYVFSDAIDINLLFWSELSLYLMLQTDRRWVWLSGAAAGAAFMSKTFPALFVLVPLALVILLRAKGFWPVVKKEEVLSRDPNEDSIAGSEIAPRPARKGQWISTLLGWVIAFLLVALPWNIYCAIRYPVEFTAEYGLILTHLSGDVENWAGPWDRLWFQHLPSALYLFWTTSLVGSIVLTFRAIQLKRWDWLFVPVWIAAVLIPFTLATSKTPSATLPAWPALMLGGAFLIWRACQGYVVEMAALVTLLVAMTFFAGEFITIGWGMTEPFALMRQAQWIAWHAVAGLCAAGIALALADVRLARLRLVFVAIVLALLVTPTWRTWKLAAAVKRIPQPPDLSGQLTRYGAHLPPNAVVFLTQPVARRRNEVMFYLDRTTYPLPDTPSATADAFKEAHDAGADIWVFDPDRARGGNPLFHVGG
jgi:4-amino-4-deoxy-L-arabinose transferase-like glycosyltransferase